MYIFRDNCDRWVNVASASGLWKEEGYNSVKKDISPPDVIDSDTGIS